MFDTIAIHRGRNSKSTEICKAITSIDYNFDFRGFHGGSKLNPFWLLLKAWITSKEIPPAKNYFIEGGMLFWVGFFLKKRYPNSNLFLMVPEPAFYLDLNKSFIAKKFFYFKIAMMKKTVKHYFLISQMIVEDAKKYLGNDISYSILRHYVNNIEQFTFNKNEKKENIILFVIERPNDTGYVKGLDIAIKIFENLDKQDIKLYLVGSGTENLSFNNPNIKGLGFCNMQEIYKKAKILIAPARYDAFPLVIAEASLSGVIPIISNNVGMKELLNSDMVIDIDNIEKWIKAIEKYIDMDDTQRYEILEKLNIEFRRLNQKDIIEKFKDEYAKLSN